MADAKIEKQKVKEITDKLEEGLKELFESEKYKSYLSTMSKFHNYSFNNTLLIALQKPEASLVAGFKAWQTNFNRHVKKGEKGIRILAPAPYKVKEERDRLDPVTGEVMLDENGMPQKEEVEVKIPAFRVVSVFDISQTDGEPLPELETKELLSTVEGYEDFLKAVTYTAPAPVSFEDIPGDSKGYFSPAENRIAVQEGMSESQTLKTLIHETAHSILHRKEVDSGDIAAPAKDRNTKEVEAESVAYTVCQHFGIDTSEYSFGYIAGWSSGKDMKELKSSLDTIRRTASELITGIEGQLQELQRDRELMQEQEKESVLLIENSDHSEYSLLNVRGMDAAELVEALASMNEDDRLSIAAYLESRGAWTVEITNEKTEDAGERRPDVRYNTDTNEITEAAEEREQPEPEEKEAENVSAEYDGLPDPEISISDMREYGYTWEEMLPLTKETAWELFGRDLPIYQLHMDGSETLVEGEEQIAEYEGIFGIEKGDWENERNLRAMQAELAESQPAKEAQLLYGSSDRYGIYQLKDEPGLRDYHFAGTAEMLKRGRLSDDYREIQPGNYNLVYVGELSEIRGGTQNEKLEALFEKFNIDHPEDFKGHSLSVSDLVVLHEDGENSAHFVDSYGFTDIPDFIRALEGVREQEMEKADPEEAPDTSGHDVQKSETEQPEQKAEEKGNTPEYIYEVGANPRSDSAENSHFLQAYEVREKGQAVPRDVLYVGTAEKCRELMGKLEAGEMTQGDVKEMSAKAQEALQEPEQAGAGKYPAVYWESLTYAMEHGEVDDHLDSRRLDRECKKAIEETIRQNFDGMHLNQDIVEPLAEKYGSERIAFVLANTLQQESWDGRFSRDNKEWAAEFPIPENIVRGMDMNSELIVSSHPAVLDGFIDMFRSEVLEKELSAGQGKTTSGHDVQKPEAEQPETEQPETQARQDEPEKPEGTPEFEDMEDGDEIIDLGDERDRVLAEMKQSLEGRQEETEERELAFQIADRFISIQETDGGYDYSIMDMDYKVLEGGVYDDPDVPIREALKDIVDDLKTAPRFNGAAGNIGEDDELLPIDYDRLMETVEAANRIEPQESEVDKFRAKTAELFHDISEMNPSEIEETVRCHVQAVLDETGIDAVIVDAAVVGSRCRGLEREDSDLDVVVELSTNEREDTLFDAFNADGLHIGGVRVDINPITAQRTGTLESYLPQAEAYLDELRGEREAAQQAHTDAERQEPEVTLTVAECGEFHSLGEFYENIPTVEEAVAIWKQIPPERMNGIPAIGINIHEPGAEPFGDVEADLVSGKRIDLEILDHIPDMKNNPKVMELAAQLVAELPDMEIDGVMTEKMEARVWELRLPKLDEAGRLAVEIDRFSYAYDADHYHDGSRNMTENVLEIRDALEKRDAYDIAAWLTDVAAQGTEPEEAQKAVELLEKLTEYKPLAKIEETEEQNYNMIDNVLNNGAGEEAQKEAAKREQEQPAARVSLKARLAEKKAQVAGKRDAQEKENSREARREIGS